MIVYIAGPVTGKPLGNRPAFEAAAAILRAQGHEPLNPLDIFTEPPPVNPTPAEARAYWIRAMRTVLPWLLRADAIAMLPGWKGSEGAHWEHLIATGILDMVPTFVLEHPKVTYERVIEKIDGIERDMTSHWAQELGELQELARQEVERDRQPEPAARESWWPPFRRLFA